MAKKLKPGEIYDGPRAIATNDDGVTAFFAINPDGSLGARLVQVDLAPDNPDGHDEEYRVAADGDPAQKPAPQPGNTVELEPEGVLGSASTEV